MIVDHFDSSDYNRDKYYYDKKKNERASSRSPGRQIM